MKFIVLLNVLLVMAIGAEVRVKTADGVIEGVVTKMGCTVFHGVPFAAAPEKELRWKRYGFWGVFMFMQQSELNRCV